MSNSMTKDPRAEHDLHVIDGLIQKLTWSFNAGGTELVRADVRSLADAFEAESREPASWVLDAWLAKQVQRAA
jgi:hypothetical protein